MCCFTDKVKDVNTTRIFVRGTEGGRQLVVYQMRLETENPVAMILPLPVARKTQEEDVRFIDLQKFPSFFADLENGFDIDIAAAADGNPLKVYDVGNYIASFAPTVDDMDRLEPQFRLPKGVWKELPNNYAEAGFAVFQLKAGRLEYHPMAFEFPRRDSRSIFFPTVHIHDGKVHNKAKFDHRLYCQMTGMDKKMLPEGWLESFKPAGMFMKNSEEASKVLVADAHVYRVEYSKRLKNELRENKDLYL